MKNNSLTPEEFAGKYGAERIARLMPLLEDYGYVTITEAGALMLAEAKRISTEPFGSQLDPADRPAAERLRAWRKSKAREENVSAYIVLSNKKLFALAAAHPATALELAFLGVSRKLIDTSLTDILSACRRDASPESPCSPSPSTGRARVSTAEVPSNPYPSSSTPSVPCAIIPTSTIPPTLAASTLPSSAT